MSFKHGSSLSRRRFLTATTVAAGLAATRSATSSAGTSASARLRQLDRALELDELHTPALVLDQDAFERNLKRMAEHAKAAGIGLRPHAKTHKCPIIARRQMELGAIGICCAKVGEAEAMADGGLQKILITSPVATQEKVDRVLAVAARIDELIMIIDHPQSVTDFDQAAAAAGITLDVLVGLDTGTRRTGIPLGKPAQELARAVTAAANLRFRGLQAYAGHVMHIEGHAERAKASRETLQRCLETRKRIEDDGLTVEIFSCGGTGTFDIDSEVKGVTDLQVGSYCFMDVQYRMIGDREGELFDTFEPSLFVLSTAISQPVPELITIDAGLKAFAFEPNAKPQFADLEGMIYHYGGDEHGIVQFTGDARPLKRGDKARLLVSHCDPTVNLYDVIHPVQNGRVTELWPIDGRGRSQ